MTNSRILIPLGVLLCFLFPACSRDKKKIIGVVAMGRSHLFWQSIHAGAVAAAQETGAEILWNAPASETDYAGQLQIVDAMINRQVDAICLAPIDKNALAGSVGRAARLNIPVIIFDSPIETELYTSRVATDNYGAGRMAAERMAQILNGKGKVAIVAGAPGAASSLAREKGFEDFMKEKFPGIQIVDKRFSMSDFAKSMAVAENILTARPELDGLFASNEASSVGTAQALKPRQGRVKMVGFDWSPNLLEDLRTGLIDSLVAQHPFQIGHDAVVAAMDKLQGKPVPKIRDLPPRLITRENLSDPDVQAQVNPDLKKYLN